MTQFILFALLGLGTGAAIAVIAMGVVLTYRSSGVINMAMAVPAMIAAYVVWWMVTKLGLPTWLGAVGGLASSVVSGLAMELMVIRPLRVASPVAKLLATVGVLLTGQAAIVLIVGPQPETEPALMPSSNVTILGAPVPVEYLLLAGIALAVGAVLTIYLRRSMFGLETKAAFEDEGAATWIGLSPNRLSLVNGLAASIVSGGFGVLMGSVVTLDPSTVPLLVVPALTAALFANLTSLPVACIVGLLIGCAENVLYWVSTLSWAPKDQGVPLPGVQPLLVFILMVIVVVVRGAKLPRRGDIVERLPPPVPRPERILRPAIIALVVGVVTLIVFPYHIRQAEITSLVYVTLTLSLIVITGYIGQISVMQLALSGGAGFVMSHMATNYGIGFPLDAILGVAAATLIGVGVGMAGLRVRGVQLALVSIAAVVAIQAFWFGNATWGGGDVGAPIAQPSLFGFNFGSTNSFRGLDGGLPSPVLGIVMLVFTVGFCAFVAHMRRTRVGQEMVVVRSNERAAAGVGINVRRIKVYAFTVSSFLAAVAGVMAAINLSSVTADTNSAIDGLSVVAFAYIAGIAVIPGAVIAGLNNVDAFVPHLWQRYLGLSGNLALLIGGVFLVFTVIYFPGGVAGEHRKRRDLERAGLPYESEFSKSRLHRGVALVVAPVGRVTAPVRSTLRRYRPRSRIRGGARGVIAVPEATVPHSVPEGDDET